MKAIDREAAIRSGELRQRSVGTVYIGGGTPTVLGVRQLECLLKNIRERVRIDADAEFTVEANPNSLSTQMLDMLKAHGVNRISIGVQSFSREILEWLGRIHTADEAEAAVDRARRCGYDNISIDLIYGTPGLSRSLWRESVCKAIGLQTPHISAYSLSLDEGSRLHREVQSGAVVLPDDELIALHYEDAQELLEQAGYQHYEISNYCRPSFECRHNMNYWDRGEYVGLGPAAWSFLGQRRSRNSADIKAYLEDVDQGRAPADFSEDLNERQAATEALFLGLRRAGGIDLAAYGERYGSSAREDLVRRVDGLSGTELYVVEGGRLRLSRKGMLIYNEAMSRILP